MSFMSSDARERNKYIERSLENTLEVLRTSDASDFLGEIATSRAAFIEDNYAVASVRHGMVSLKGISESQVPIITLAENDQVKIGPEFQKFMPIQKRAMCRALGVDEQDYPTRDRMISLLTPSLRGGLLNISTANALVSELSDNFDLSPLAHSNEPLLYNVTARPMVVLKYRNDAYRVNPSTIAHENEHVIQALRAPVCETPQDGDWSDYRLRRELPAYHIQAMVLKAMQAMGYRPRMEYLPVQDITPEGEYVSDIFIIDRIRQHVNEGRENPFETSQELKDELATYGFASIYQSHTGGAIS